MTLSETLERISKMDVPTSERSTIRQIILPVLSALGWDVDNSNGTHEVRDEYQVSSLKGSGKVDIALMGKHSQCVCLVEAKSPGINLDDYVMQLFKYDASNASDTICVLTDGLEWRFYLPREKGSPEDRQFARLRLQEDTVEQIADDLRKFLSRSAVVNGEAERNAVESLKQRRRENDISQGLQDIWRKMLTEPDEVLVDRVRRKVSEELMFSVSVEQVSEFLDARIALSQSDHHDTERSGSSSKDAKKASTRSPEIVGATVLGIHEHVTTWTGLVVFTAEQLYDHHPHDFLDKIRDFKGRKRDWVSKDDSTMTDPREIRSSGIFVEAGWSGHIECKRQSRRLLELFDYTESALQIYEH